MRLPHDENGYTVTSNGTVHTRYADHAEGARTRTAKGAGALGAKRVCRVCYPLPESKKKS